jgi:Cu(I)/Ag(I) efflux system membrane fusion protein
MKSKKIVIVFLALFCCSLVLMGCKDTTEENAVAEIDAAVKSEQQIWTCPMHPEIQKSETGLCPKCTMNLIPLKSDK